jgi:hypothetical protein
MAMKGRPAQDGSAFEGHVVVATNEEIEAIRALPSACYGPLVAGAEAQREVRLAAGSTLVLQNVDAMHWLLSGELPGTEGPANPCAILQRGGETIEAEVRYVFEDGTRWACGSARCFSPEAQREALAAISNLDEAALRRKGGEVSVAQWRRLCELLGVEDPATRFVVASSVCMRLAVGDLPMFNPALPAREKRRGRHARGSLPDAIAARGVAIGGESFVGFGAGPARAFRSERLEELAGAALAPAVEKLRKAAKRDGKGLIAYERLANDSLYTLASYWLGLGYFDADEVRDQLGEETDATEEVIAMAVAATCAILELERSTWPAVTDCDRLFAALDRLRAEGFLVFEYAGFVVDQGYELVEQAMAGEAVEARRPFCFFHQQCILRARDGEGLDLYFGEAHCVAEGVDIDVSQDVGARVAGALAEQGLTVKWDGTAEDPMVVPMLWRCRPRRAARALP